MNFSLPSVDIYIYKQDNLQGLYAIKPNKIGIATHVYCGRERNEIKYILIAQIF